MEGEQMSQNEEGYQDNQQEDFDGQEDHQQD
jgi:hypothetical protein